MRAISMTKKVPVIKQVIERISRICHGALFHGKKLTDPVAEYTSRIQRPTTVTGMEIFFAQNTCVGWVIYSSNKKPISKVTTAHPQESEQRLNYYRLKSISSRRRSGCWEPPSSRKNRISLCRNIATRENGRGDSETSRGYKRAGQLHTLSECNQH